MKDYKIGFIIFLFLATVISLFPPFEFGSSGEHFPIKRYDFLFSQKRKLISVGRYDFKKKIYDNLKTDIDTIDALKVTYITGIDTFFSFYNNQSSQVVNTKPILRKSKNKYTYIFYLDDNSKIDYGLSQPNHKEVKAEFNKVGIDLSIEPIQPYKIFTVTKPQWYNVTRSLLVDELLIHYFLALIFSIAIQLFVNRKRGKKNRFNELQI